MAVFQLIFWWNFMMLRRWSSSIRLPTKFRYLRCPVWTPVSPSSSTCTRRTPRAPVIRPSSMILLKISKDWVLKVMSPQEEVEDIILYLPPAEFLCYSIRNCISFNRIEEHLLCWIFFSGVTDFKAVVDSSTSDAPPTSYSLLLITSSVGGIFVVTVLTLCIVFTYRRKVRHWDIITNKTQNMRKSFFCGFFSSGISSLDGLLSVSKSHLLQTQKSFLMANVVHL